MALRIYPEGDYIVFNDVGTTFVQAAHYSNVRWRRNFDGNIEFVNLAENSTVIVAAPVEQIVDATDTPYGATIDDFNAAFSAVLPSTGGGNATLDSLLVATFAIRDSVIITQGYVNEIRSQISIAMSVQHTLRNTVDTFETPVNARRVQLVALAGGAFTVNGISYPVTTANGVIDALEVGNGIAPLNAISYDVTAGSVLQIVEI